MSRFHQFIVFTHIAAFPPSIRLHCGVLISVVVCLHHLRCVRLLILDNPTLPRRSSLLNGPCVQITHTHHKIGSWVTLHSPLSRIATSMTGIKRATSPLI